MKQPPKAVDVEADLPIVETVGFEQTAKGWVVVICKVKGSRVVDKEVVAEPMGRHNAVELLKVVMGKRLILGIK